MNREYDNPYRAEGGEEPPCSSWRRIRQLLAGGLVGGFVGMVLTLGTGDYRMNAIPVVGAILGTLAAALFAR